MYYRIFQLSCCLLIFCTSCRQEYTKTSIEWCAPGSRASQLLITDGYEGYLDDVSADDIALQMQVFIPEHLVAREVYEQWLPTLIAPWDTKSRELCEAQLSMAIRQIEKRFPKLLPDTIQMVLLEDRPYGELIYFTRNNAIFAPRFAIENSSKEALYEVFIHELFHLISRRHQELRPELYAIANFKAISAVPSLDSLEHLMLLLNPDAPNYNYTLAYQGKEYLPVLFARDSAHDFTDALDYAFFELSTDANTVTNKRLLDFKVVEATRANTAYFIHPEEILAEHFSLLFTADEKQTRYPEAIEALERLLKARSSAL